MGNTQQRRISAKMGLGAGADVSRGVCVWRRLQANRRKRRLCMCFTTSQDRRMAEIPTQV